MVRISGSVYKPKEQKHIILDICKLDDNLRGVAYVGAKRYAVSGALPREKVLAVVKKTENNVSYADVKSVLEAAPERTEPFCRYYGKCGYCRLMHADYAAGLKQKTDLVRKKLWSLGVRSVEECVSMGKTACKNRAVIAFKRKDGAVEAGVFDPETQKVTNIKGCHLFGGWYAGFIKILNEWANEYGPGDAKSLKGVLSFAEARYIDGALLLTLVSPSPSVKNLEELYNSLAGRFRAVSLWLCVKSDSGGDTSLIHIAGQKRLQISMLGVRCEIGPFYLFAENEKTAEAMYKKLADIIKETGAEYVVEAYPDIGLAAALFAKAGAKVVSVKPTPDSERRAKKLCNKNEITGVEYLCGSVGEILPALTPRGKTALLISSSKQEGNFGQAVLKFSPDIILYLSSDISRLTDDLLPLCDNGYSVVSATPYDSIPYSCNVETLVCLAKTIK